MRKGSTRASVDQELVAVGKLEERLGVKDGKTVFKPTVMGTYFGASQTFAMYKHGETATPDFSDIDKQIEGTAIHEIAHGLFEYAEADFVKAFDYWLDADTKSGKAGAEPPPTKYGQTSAAEDIAECAMLYFLDRPRLEKDCPLRCAFMDKLVEGLGAGEPPVWFDRPRLRGTGTETDGPPPAGGCAGRRHPPIHPQQGVTPSMHRRSLAVLVCALAVACVAPAAASAAPTWAPASTAPIHPGVMTFTDGAQCTANFVFYDASDVYIGQAAHCSGTGTATETDGCDSGSLPIGTPVEVDGASQPGTLVYNSWLTMQAKGETDPDTCAYNDFALIKLNPADAGKVNPSIPYWGGPNAIGATTALRDKVYSYGNSSLRRGVTQLSPKEGYSLGDDGGGWTHTVYTLTPGIPGDSGSAFLSKTGAALGTLSTVAIAPITGSNGVGDVAKELAT